MCLDKHIRPLSNDWKVITSTNKNMKELSCWWECKIMHPLWETVWQFLKKKVSIIA
jgi:hypothetical protein